MEEHLKQILDELYTLDPTLRKEEDLVRVLVLEMLNNKPTVTMDESLKEMVKARLLAQFETAKTPVRTQSSLSWLWYTAPVGVTALLLLLTTPQFGSSPAGYLPPNTSTFREVAAPPKAPTAPSMDATEAFDAGSSARTSKAMPEHSVDEPVSDMMTFSAKEGSLTSNSIYLATQKVGAVVYVDSVTTDSHSFVVIRDINTLEILGVVEVDALASGLPTEVQLNKQLEAGLVYEAALYLDTGNGVLDINIDNLVFSSSFSVDL